MSHSPFFNGNTTTKENDTRQKEFENSLGNLLVAEYQVFRLRERIKNHLGSTGNMESEFMFKVGDEWFRINVSAQKQYLSEKEEKKEKEKLDEEVYQTTGMAWFPDETIGAP